MAKTDMEELIAENARLRKILDLSAPPLHIEMRAREVWSFIKRFNDADWFDEPQAIRRLLDDFREEARNLIANIPAATPRTLQPLGG